MKLFMAVMRPLLHEEIRHYNLSGHRRMGKLFSFGYYEELLEKKEHKRCLIECWYYLLRRCEDHQRIDNFIRRNRHKIEGRALITIILVKDDGDYEKDVRSSMGYGDNVNELSTNVNAVKVELWFMKKHDEFSNIYLPFRTSLDYQKFINKE